MSETAPIPEEFELEALAMEYSVGLLSATQHAAAAERLARDPAFARAVEKWDRNCAPLALEAREAAPPPHAWGRIEAAIAPGSQRAAVAIPWWDKLVFWRATTGLGLAGAFVALLVALGSRPAVEPASVQAPLVAVLAPATPEPHAAVATYYPDTHRLVIAAAIGAPADKSAEVWLIPEGEAPLSIGFVTGPEVVLELAEAHAREAQAGAVLAVTIEPLGGAPGGVATGPVVSAGPLRTLG